MFCLLLYTNLSPTFLPRSENKENWNFLKSLEYFHRADVMIDLISDSFHLKVGEVPRGKKLQICQYAQSTVIPGQAKVNSKTISNTANILVYYNCVDIKSQLLVRYLPKSYQIV